MKIITWVTGIQFYIKAIIMTHPFLLTTSNQGCSALKTATSLPSVSLFNRIASLAEL